MDPFDFSTGTTNPESFPTDDAGGSRGRAPCGATGSS